MVSEKYYVGPTHSVFLNLLCLIQWFTLIRNRDATLTSRSEPSTALNNFILNLGYL